jgi:hypothetical protein
MLIVIDVMGTGEVEIDTSSVSKPKDVKKKRRPLITDLPQLEIVVTVPTRHR